MPHSSRPLARYALVALFLAAALVAPQAARASQDEVQSVITRQIESFIGGDFETAYSFAAPNVKAAYPSARIFSLMVKQGYAPVFSPQSYRFGPYEDAGNMYIQRVEVIGPDGHFYTADYTVKKFGDAYLITGCFIRKATGISL
ncbi:DUF4864 domain-containing protein [Tepidamorphus sp. 3E244]|uniref:DUF4864 domain-containing protein n=1 Tax=Tepidamorphus sp. 3E244 TaxID=3385498 RepID=UPI0038FCA334